MIRTSQKYGTVVVTEMDGESAGLIELRLQQKDWMLLSAEEARTVARMLTAAARRVAGRKPQNKTSLAVYNYQTEELRHVESNRPKQETTMERIAREQRQSEIGQ